ncbi:MAG TPA: hypothetical protein VFB59_00950 [Candidatus Saccharimonadales bacterium]|nr:hypothetical protein [Candidatus Saccharimonadales bacterium]
MSTTNNRLRASANLATMSSMKTRLTEAGFVNSLLIPLVMVVLLLVGSAGFGVWAFMSRQDYKDNTDQKIAVAVDEAKVATQTAEAAKFAEEAKNPLKTFTGPSDFGSVTFQYPKTWSGYVVQATAASGDTPLDSYFHPNVVPSVDLPASVFALRVAVVNESYSSILEQFANSVETGKVSVAPYKLPKVQGVIGSRLEGEIEQTKKGVMVLFPLRNVTLKVWTETDQYVTDFNDIVLANLSFSP